MRELVVRCADSWDKELKKHNAKVVFYIRENLVDRTKVREYDFGNVSFLRRKIVLKDPQVFGIFSNLLEEVIREQAPDTVVSFHNKEGAEETYLDISQRVKGRKKDKMTPEEAAAVAAEKREAIRRYNTEYVRNARRKRKEQQSATEA